MLISGEVVFPPNTDAFSDAALVVELRDTRLADSPARILQRQVSRGISYDPNANNLILFSVVCDVPPEDYLPEINVLVDLDRDEHIGRGDFINMQSYCLHPSASFLRIEVRRVP